ncbi:MAG: hypothetical protein EHM20_17445 [Alphaproteobacteria bacterium]|nr:MAG: hypothetical protein EHM20_17445 [Alphaproteobacteria bacterium]
MEIDTSHQQSTNYKIAKYSSFLFAMMPIAVGTFIMSLRYFQWNSSFLPLNRFLNNYNYRLFSNKEIYIQNFNELILSGWSCLIFNAVMGATVGYIGLKYKKKWIWKLILFLFFCCVVHDLLVTIFNPILPMTPIVPFLFLGIWLFTSKKHIWAN